MKLLKDFKFRGKRALVRCDFNVPVDEQGNILDDFRIQQSIPTIQYLKKQGAKIILMSHLGKPEGKVAPNLTMDKVQEVLVKYLKAPVTKTPDCIGFEVEQYSFGLNQGEVLLLENLRFHQEEIDNDPEFAKFLSTYGDIYVNDAFGVCHRNHASVVGVPQHIPGCVGLLVEKEITNLGRLIRNPKRPVVVLIGGEKVETKAPLIDNISRIADYVLVGGLIKKEMDENNMIFNHQEKIVCPVDAVEFDGGIPDIGPKTIEFYKSKIKNAKTILWNGPFGDINKEEYCKGTLEIAKAITNKWFCYTVAGGGETVEFIRKYKLLKKFDHISTGGGAMLSYLGGNDLPAFLALQEYEDKNKN